MSNELTFIGFQIRQAIENKQLHTLQSLLEDDACTAEVLLERCVKFNSTSLHLAIETGSSEIVSALVNSKHCTEALLSAVNSQGYPALCAAISKNSEEMTEAILLSKHCQKQTIVASTQDRSRCNALHLAVMSKNNRIVRALLNSKYASELLDARCRPILLSYNPFELAALDANTEMLTDFICHPAFMKSKQNLKEIHISLDIELLGIKGAVALFEKRKHYLYQTEKLITALSSKIDYFNKKNYKDKMLVRKVRDELKAAKEEYEGGILTPELQESFEAACFNVLREARNAEVKQHLQVFRGGIRGLIDSFLKCIGCDAQIKSNRGRFFVPQTKTEVLWNRFEELIPQVNSPSPFSS